ncbi:hypothetical protein CS063_04660 [Sporanaerobium hydrogeniformans]|uniref:Uncharacterized protein n=1 Tax=Sporanaerobium hydrogeniformans TaxID=3072179 RepID=A0AC61DF65_9FIRM|nr:hypothetical protein [Sporanaerobium hydrogeniformans]PHV71850.1 hypothetical protein CS063_04660 [Sporanaerobium hydrogeniformans]
MRNLVNKLRSQSNHYIKNREATFFVRGISKQTYALRNVGSFFSLKAMRDKVTYLFIAFSFCQKKYFL